MAQPEPSVVSRTADAESALLVSKHCQRNGLLAEVSRGTSFNKDFTSQELEINEEARPPKH